MTDDDKEFIIRALAMHAALTRMFGPENMTMDQQAALYEKWIRRHVYGATNPETDVLVLRETSLSEASNVQIDMR